MSYVKHGHSDFAHLPKGKIRGIDQININQYYLFCLCERDPEL